MNQFTALGRQEGDVPRLPAECDFTVSGIWTNVGEADLGIWCKTCETWVKRWKTDDVPLSEFLAAVYAHRRVRRLSAVERANSQDSFPYRRMRRSPAQFKGQR